MTTNQENDSPRAEQTAEPGGYSDMESEVEIELAIEWWLNKINKMYKAGLSKTEEYYCARRRMEHGRYFLRKMQYSGRSTANDRDREDIKRMRRDPNFRWDTPGKSPYSGRGMEDYLDDQLDRWRSEN